MDVNTLAIGFLVFLARIGDVSIGTVRTIVTVQGRSVVALQSALRYYMKLSLIKSFAAGIILLVAVAGRPSIAFTQPTELSMRDHLRQRIEDGGLPLKISVFDEPIHAAIVLPVFYERRAYQPAWTDHNGSLPQTETLLEAVRWADREGLNPGDYHLAIIEATLSAIRQTAGIGKAPNFHQLIDLDLLLTDAFLIYGAHLLAGRVDPEKIHPQWFANRREADLARLLEEALSSNRIREALGALLPDYAGYKRLRNGLATYRKFAEYGWPTVPPGHKLQPGERSGIIPILRQRLAAEGLLRIPEGTDQELFDPDLVSALKQFQLQNNLEVDGILGPQTLQALNVAAAKRVRQIAVNMERWRWLPQNLGERYIQINIAGYELDVIERETPVLNMRVVVGRTYRKTPVFSDRITYLVLNPYWGVPDSIAQKDILPRIKKEPNYLISQKIRVFERTGGNAREIAPHNIDWHAISAGSLPYRFKQDPGPQNALGRIKFMFPNRFNVYLHDTPSKELFAKARRDFSSGCIRLEKPVELAEYLLRKNPDWPPEKIRMALASDDFAARTIQLLESVNIHILYWTSWVGSDGHLYFGPDIYNRDEAVDRALQALPPSVVR